MPSSCLFFLIAADAIRMVQRVVARYRPAVAAILPNTLNTLNNYRGPADQVTSLYMGMRNQTVPILVRHGHCFSDARSSLSSTVTLRRASKGDPVHPVPLFLRPASEASRQCEETGEGICLQNRDPSGDCWSRPGLSVEVCPLLGPASFVRIVELSSVGESTVTLRWSPWESAADPFQKLNSKKNWDGVEQVCEAEV